MVSCINVMIWAHEIGATWIPLARKKVLEFNFGLKWVVMVHYS